MDEKSFDAKRRNLLIATFLLLFIKYADADVQSSATVSVLKFEVGNPQAIIQGIWLLWAYFFIRAYQHFRYYMLTEYKRSIQRFVVPMLHPYISGAGVPEEHEKFFFEEIERFHKYKLSFRPNFVLESVGFSLADVKRALGLLLSNTPKKGRGRINLLCKPGYRSVRWYSALRRQRWGRGDAWRIVVWTITDRSIMGGGKMPVEVVEQVGVGFFTGVALQIRIQFSLLFRSAPFFECRLPFLLALSPLLYYGWQPTVVSAQTFLSERWF